MSYSQPGPSMCGILVVFPLGSAPNPNFEANCKSRLSKLTHRGPDKQHSICTPQYFLGHTRLCIQGTSTSSQPIVHHGSARQAVPSYTCANAEIYNAADILGAHEFETDCLAIPVIMDPIPVNEQDLVRAVNRLDGIFSFVHVQGTRVTVARSVCGVMNLYYGYDPCTRHLLFTSERKTHPKAFLRPFPPSHVLSFDLGQLDSVEFSNTTVMHTLDKHMTRFERLTNPIAPPTGTLDLSTFRQLLTTAVEKRLKTVRLPECGFLLSGGLDSSVIVAIARLLYPDTEIRTFSIGLDSGSSDVPVAEKVAAHLNTVHTSYTFTLEEGVEALPKVVAALETIDTTTVRAGTPMYLLIQKIKKDHPELKVLFSGEGADELLYGYLTWHESPSLDESRKFSTYLLEKLYQFDVLRAHQTGMAHSVEVRVPFLDRMFVQYVTQLHPAFLTPICGKEKYFLRKAFQHLLPACVIDRQKEQFSDGVGTEWIDMLRKAEYREFVEHEERLAAFGDADTTKEQLHVFDMCRQALGLTQFTLLCEQFDTWAPQFSDTKDPSGRSAEVYTLIT